MQIQVIDETAHAADLDGEGMGRQVPVHVSHRHHGSHKFRRLVIGPAEYFIKVAVELTGDCRIGDGGDVLDRLQQRVRRLLVAYLSDCTDIA
jgi:hypothetical protein